MHVRDYQAADLEACMALFDSNLDPYFVREERAEFEAYLQELPEGYLVVESDDGRLLACGGYAVEKSGHAIFCWGMVLRDTHRSGVGTLLAKERLARIAAHTNATEVHLHTSQHTTGFYQRFGFTETKRVMDGYGPGLDRHDMVLKLNAN